MKTWPPGTGRCVRPSSGVTISSRTGSERSSGGCPVRNGKCRTQSRIIAESAVESTTAVDVGEWPSSPVARLSLAVEESALAWARGQLNRQIECMYRLHFTSEPPQHGGSRGVQQVVAREVACQRVKLRQSLLRTGRFR